MIIFKFEVNWGLGQTSPYGSLGMDFWSATTDKLTHFQCKLLTSSVFFYIFLKLKKMTILNISVIFF